MATRGGAGLQEAAGTRRCQGSPARASPHSGFSRAPEVGEGSLPRCVRIWGRRPVQAYLSRSLSTSPIARSLSRESGSSRPAQGPGLVQSTGRWKVGRAGIGGLGEIVLLLPSRPCWWGRCDFCTNLCFQSLFECRSVNENKAQLLLWIGVEIKGIGEGGKGGLQNSSLALSHPEQRPPIGF